MLRDALAVMAVPCVSAPGFEADDVIATLTHAASAHDHRVYICSRDKDLRQLLSDTVSVLDMGSGEQLTPEELRNRQGIRPEQVPDLLALTGDKVDSIPGIPGIGPKTAAQLLSTYSCLESVLEHWSDIGGKLGTRIREHRDQVLLAKELVTLRTDVPVSIALEDYALRLPGKERLEPIFRELGLGRLVERLA